MRIERSLFVLSAIVAYWLSPGLVALPTEYECSQMVKSLSRVGESWMGHKGTRQYSNWATTTGEPVFLKRYALAGSGERQFTREVAAMESFPSHPYIASLICSYRSNQYGYLLTDSLVGGIPLSKSLLEQGEAPFPLYSSAFVEESRLLVYQLRVALDHLHANGVYHNDIKPANMLYNRRGQIKVIDFDLACVLAFEEQCPIGGTRGFYHYRVWHYLTTPDRTPTMKARVQYLMRSNVNDWDAAAGTLMVMGGAAQRETGWAAPFQYELGVGRTRRNSKLFANLVNFVLEQSDTSRSFDFAPFWNAPFFHEIDDTMACRAVNEPDECRFE